MSTINFDKDWYFSQEQRDACIDNRYDFSSWRQLNIPHDWSMEHPYDRDAQSGRKGGFVRTGVAYYKKTLNVTKAMLKKHVAIEFDGVYRNSEVYINGHLLGVRPFGYISFAYVLSDHLVEGVNIITVKVDDSMKESSRWFNGCGIYRHVSLRVTEKVRVDRLGTYITTPLVQADRAEVKIESLVINALTNPIEAQVFYKIYDREGQCVAESFKEQQLGVGDNKILCEVDLIDPKRWSLEDPNLYICETTICNGEDLLDVSTCRFGVRKLTYISNEGFFLNDQNLKLKGVCLHHDAGIYGAAVPDKVNRKKLQLLKDMGCNAIRTSHNPFASEFYDLCDELGLMVMDEIFDGWETKKAEADYGLYFEEWHERDLTEFIKRDRNHPCIIMWSIGNEVTDMTTKTNMRLNEMVKALDDTRPITCGVPASSEISENNRAILDIAGYNDGGGACFLYDRDHKTRPDQLMVATEAPHTYATRGFYRTQTWWRDKNQARIEIENLSEEEIFFDGHLAFRSSYDNSGVRVGIRDSWTLSEKRPFLLGEFRWTGFDYYGESYGWPARWCDSGVIGTDNCPKDGFYLYQSMWKEGAMVHLLPHWTHPQLDEATEIPVVVYSNCEEVELFLNGSSLGRQVKGDQKQFQWKVAYKPGKIEAVAYNKKVDVARKSYLTAGEPSRIKVTSDTKTLKFDGVDTAQIDVRVCDEKGVYVPYGENIISYKAYGDVKVIGTENGCAVDTTPIYSTKRKAFNSLCTAAVIGKEVGRGMGAGGVMVSSILGNLIFKERTSVSVDIQSVDLAKGKNIYTRDLQCMISINEGPWKHYVSPIEINVTSKVSLRVYKDEVLVDDLSAMFIKGEKEKVIDLLHGNKVENLDKPIGPFASEMSGLWTDGRNEFEFKDNGDFIRVIGGDNKQHMGYWWYDFPADPFEAQEYAGTGEVWYNSGERNKLELVTKDGEEAILDNSETAIRTAYNVPKSFKLKKVN